jgi:tripartite-type tricarboxylate transporter receptor subunit TctC
MFVRRLALSGMLALVCTLMSVLAAAAQSYPARQITLVVPATPGGSNDTIARIVAAHMGKTLGQSIIIENIGGAGGTTAARRVAQAAPDGYTIMAGNMGTHGAAPAQYSDLRYDPVNDFTPIGQMAGAPAVIIARKDFPANTLKEFVDYVRHNQSKVNEAHAGVGSQMHTFCTYLHALMGTKTARIAYRGGGPAVTDLMTGHADFSCISLNSVVGQIQAGTIKAIAVASPERADVIKNVPTAAEGGLASYQVSSWNALFAPRGLPPDIAAKLNDALVRALDDVDTRKRLLEIGTAIPAKPDRTPQALHALVGSEVTRWSSVLKGTEGSAN